MSYKPSSENGKWWFINTLDILAPTEVVDLDDATTPGAEQEPRPEDDPSWPAEEHGPA